MSATKTDDNEIVEVALEAGDAEAHDAAEVTAAQEHDRVPMYQSDESCESLDTTEDVRRILELRDKAIFVRELAMTVSLIPYIFVSWPFTDGWIGWTIVFNGVLCHGAHAVKKPWAKRARIHDVCWNIFFFMYVNLFTHWQPQSLFITFFVLGAWLANGGNTEQGKSFLIHIVCVQWLSWVALLVYEYKL
jgi:hypothetical protein